MNQLPDGLLADIIADPDNDTLRLIGADWWDEHGEPERAEFVRVQCRLAEIERQIRERQFFHGLLLERDRLQKRERELLDIYQCAWLGVDISRFVVPAQFAGKPLLCPWAFRRGFVESVSLPCAAWLAHGPALVRQQPLAEVKLIDREPFEERTSGKSWYQWITTHFSHGQRHDLPPLLFLHLQTATDWLTAGDSKTFPTPEAARTALSLACLEYAWLCPKCHGAGCYITGRHDYPSCDACQGSGYDPFTIPKWHSFYRERERQTCAFCDYDVFVFYRTKADLRSHCPECGNILRSSPTGPPAPRSCAVG